MQLSSFYRNQTTVFICLAGMLSQLYMVPIVQAKPIIERQLTDRVAQAQWRRILDGTWMAEGYQCPFGTYHRETIRIQVTEKSLLAIKVDADGDKCVPAGMPTFWGFIPNNVTTGKAFSVTFLGGNPDNPASATLTGSLTIFDKNTLYVQPNNGEQIILRRSEKP